ncbi:hypothetical protein [Archangium sp.]|uniref:hypothetical protein n=1 Tax=Archangium sp. TaxID=1872627 RepID=UPI002D609172|nr:hypothetical protein [Archangium sp.]HYO59121.1 hypothetical protein [Archangium sp.]
MMPRILLFVFSIVLSGCVRKPEPFSTPAESDNSIIFPLSVGNGLVEVKARENTYVLDGEVLRALMVVSNDLFPPGVSNLPCRSRQEAHTYRFTRRGDIIFVYVDEDLAHCGRRFIAMDSGAKYAISKDGRILRRVIGSEPDHVVWRLMTPDGGTVTIVTEPGILPDLEDLETPDSGILKIVTEPVDMPDVMVFKRREGRSQPVEAEPGVIPGVTMLPADAGYGWEYRDGGLVSVPREPPPAPSSDRDGGSPDAGWDGGSPGETASGTR